MEKEISAFTEIIVLDPLIKYDFISCLDQYVMFGNLGRDLIKEEQIRNRFLKYKLSGNMKGFLYHNDFFYLLYNRTKRFLSSAYIKQQVSLARKKMTDLIYSTNKFIDDMNQNCRPSFCSSNSDSILNICDMINGIQNPFFENNTRKDKKAKEKPSIICEIDEKILKFNRKQINYKVIDDVSLALSIISEGLSFSIVERLFAKNNISICKPFVNNVTLLYFLSTFKNKKYQFSQTKKIKKTNIYSLFNNYKRFIRFVYNLLSKDLKLFRYSD